MKKFTLCMAITFGGISCAKALTCGHPITDDATAKSCAEGLLTQKDDMMPLLTAKNHLGDIKECDTKQYPVPAGTPSYFRHDIIDAVLAKATVDSCSVDGADYKCSVSLAQWACNISPNGTKSKSMRASMKLNADGTYVDFYPISKTQ